MGRPRKIYNAELQSDLYEFSRKLRESRKSLGYSQQYVAVQSGISMSHYKWLERGRCEPRAFVLARLSKVLEKDPDYFVSHVQSSRKYIERLWTENIDIA